MSERIINGRKFNVRNLDEPGTRTDAERGLEGAIWDQEHTLDERVEDYLAQVSKGGPVGPVVYPRPYYAQDRDGGIITRRLTPTDGEVRIVLGSLGIQE